MGDSKNKKAVRHQLDLLGKKALRNLGEKLKNESAKVDIVGLGYVGLPYQVHRACGGDK